MIVAPAHPPDCPLAFVQADISNPDFNVAWDVMGYVTLSDTGVLDPLAEDNRRMVRPRACAMGGTAIGVAIASANQTAMGTGSGIVYIVLRPKSADPHQTTF